MILRPQKNFTVVRQLADHTDSTTYYVQAVIRNAYTDEIIETLNLDDKGFQRFTKNWRVPADTSGEGFEISIVTSVYTDSGYTTKSENYGDEENSHLIEDRLSRSAGGGGMSVVGRGGSNLDQATIRRIIKEEVEKAKPEPVQIDIPKPKEYEMRWEDVLKAIDGVSKKIKEPKEVNLAPMVKKIEQAIKEKEVTQPTDLSPIVDKLDDIFIQLAEVLEEIVESIGEIERSNGDKIEKNLVKKIGNMIQGSVFTIAPTKAKMNVEVPEEPKPQMRTIDISQLTK